jgi:putative MATE family efflux protein
MNDNKTTSMPTVNQARLTQGPIAQVLMKMTGSMMIGFIAGAAFSITDAYFVSRLGTNALAAMGFTFPVTMIIFGISMGIGIGASSVISRTIGQGDYHKVKRLTVDSLLLALLLVGVFIVSGLLTIEPLFRALGANEHTLPLIADYMRIWYIGIAFLVIPIVGNNAIRATGDTLSPSIIMVVDIGLNIILDPILIFGLGPIPAMGMKGAALATVFCRALALMASLYILGKKKQMLTTERPLLCDLWESWKKILYVGMPAAIGNVLMPISAAILIRLVSVFGTEAVAAFSAGVSIERFAVIPIMALATSLLPFIGQNWGAGNFSRVREAHKKANIFVVFWGLLGVGIIASVAPWIANFFTNDSDVFKYLLTFLYIIPIAYAFRGLCHNAYSAMNAINHPYHATINILLRLFVFTIPLAAVGAWMLGFKGLLFAIIISEAASSVISVRWVKKLYDCNTIKQMTLKDSIHSIRAISSCR